MKLKREILARQEMADHRGRHQRGYKNKKAGSPWRVPHTMNKNLFDRSRGEEPLSMNYVAD